MKALKKIVSLVLILTTILALSVTTFAAIISDANPSNYAMKVVSSKDSVAIGDTVTISLYVYDQVNGEDLTLGSNDSAMASMYYDSSAFTVKSSSTVPGSDALVIAGDKITFTKNFGSESTISETIAVATIELEAIKEGSFDFYVENMPGEIDPSFGAVTFYSQEVLDSVGYGEYASMFGAIVSGATVEVAAGGEEEFTVENALATGDTMMVKNSSGNLEEVAADATNASVIAVFAKAVESKLEAETYGIVFGGVKYPGKLAVEANQSWAIKLIIPNGMLEKGSYDYGTYVGSAEPVIAANPFVVD